MKNKYIIERRDYLGNEYYITSFILYTAILEGQTRVNKIKISYIPKCENCYDQVYGFDRFDDAEYFLKLLRNPISNNRYGSDMYRIIKIIKQEDICGMIGIHHNNCGLNM